MTHSLRLQSHSQSQMLMTDELRSWLIASCRHAGLWLALRSACGVLSPGPQSN
jgi:hypothetical protein